MRKPLSIANLVLVMAFMLAVCFGGVYFVRYSILYARVSLAEEQMGEFSQMVSQAKEGSYEEGLDALEQTITHFPSGTKQREGSKLDTIVERARADAVATIVECLRRAAPADLGSEPEVWLKEAEKGRTEAMKKVTGSTTSQALE